VAVGTGLVDGAALEVDVVWPAPEGPDARPPVPVLVPPWAWDRGVPGVPPSRPPAVVRASALFRPACAMAAEPACLFVRVTRVRDVRSPVAAAGEAVRVGSPSLAVPPMRGSGMPATSLNPNAPRTRATSHRAIRPTATRPTTFSTRGRARVVAANTGFSDATVEAAVAVEGVMAGESPSGTQTPKRVRSWPHGRSVCPIPSKSVLDWMVVQP